MNCPQCQAGTMVSDTRHTRANTIRRRRECTFCGHRFTSYETTTPPERAGRKPLPLSPERRAFLRAFDAARTPEQRKARYTRDRLRRDAREESRRTGEDVKLIYARWGCE